MNKTSKNIILAAMILILNWILAQFKRVQYSILCVKKTLKFMCIQYMYQLSGNPLNVYNTPGSYLSQLLVPKFSHS